MHIAGLAGPPSSSAVVRTCIVHRRPHYGCAWDVRLRPHEAGPAIHDLSSHGRGARPRHGHVRARRCHCQHHDWWRHFSAAGQRGSVAGCGRTDRLPGLCCGHGVDRDVHCRRGQPRVAHRRALCLCGDRIWYLCRLSGGRALVDAGDLRGRRGCHGLRRQRWLAGAGPRQRRHASGRVDCGVCLLVPHQPSGCRIGSTVQLDRDSCQATPAVARRDRWGVLRANRKPGMAEYADCRRCRSHILASDLCVRRHRGGAGAERGGPRHGADRPTRDRASDDRYHDPLYRAAGGGAGDPGQRPRDGYRVAFGRRGWRLDGRGAPGWCCWRALPSRCSATWVA